MSEKCNERHLEIVYKYGKEPRTGEIAEFVAKELLPFVLYREGEKFSIFLFNMVLYRRSCVAYAEN